MSDRIQDKILIQFAGRMTEEKASGQDFSVTQLSDRELEVFELHGRGLSTREMAEALNISPKTVATHRRRIKDKLGFDSSPELVRQAVLWTERRRTPVTDAEHRHEG